MKTLSNIAALEPAPWNPREITDTALAGLSTSLHEFGDMSGIVATDEGILVAGHQRVRALRERYGPDLPIQDGALATPDGKRYPVRIVSGWSDAKIKAANVAANAHTIAGTFTPELTPVLAEIEYELPDMYGSLRLDDLDVPAAELPEPDDVEPQIDKAAELQEQWQVQRGDVWLCPSRDGKRTHRVMCGDSTEIKWESDSAVYDPPWDHAPTVQLPRPLLAFTDGYRAADSFREFGAPTWVFVWDCVSSWFTPNRPLRRMKLCLWYGIIDAYDPDGAHYGEPGTERTVSNTRGQYVYHPDPRGKHLSDLFARPITGNEHSDACHNHAKPIDWVRCLIGNCTHGSIADPFLGSGTTLIAAENLGRTCHGMEIESNYVAVALQRYKDAFDITPTKE